MYNWITTTEEHYIWVTKITCERWQRSGPVRPTLISVHFTKPFSSASPFHCFTFGKLGDAVQCFPICIHHTRTRHSACEQSYEARTLCPATDRGPFCPTLKSVHFTKLPFFTFHLARTRHSACEQGYEAHKWCPATDVVDQFLVLFGSVFLVLACDHHLSASSFDFLHFGTLPTLPEHEVRSASRVTATQKNMFAAATHGSSV